MNKNLVGIITATILAISAVSVSASPAGKAGRMEHVIENLELSDEQAKMFREVMEARHENIERFHETQRAETLTRLKDILTAEQYEEFETMTERRFRHKKDHS